MHGMRFQNGQPFRSNFTNMYYSPISVPIPVHIPNVHGLLEGETAVADHTMPVAQGFSSPHNETKQDQNEWSNLNTLVNIASATFSNVEPPERSPKATINDYRRRNCHVQCKGFTKLCKGLCFQYLNLYKNVMQLEIL